MLLKVETTLLNFCICHFGQAQLTMGIKVGEAWEGDTFGAISS